MMLKILLAALGSCCLLQGCAIRDYRDAPWDPPSSRGSLHDQIPNWDDRALRHCGGHLTPEQRRPGQTDRC